MRGLMSWVKLHPYNISQKVQIVVEHYCANVAHLLEGKAKAMVVLGSRKEAVRWKIAIDKYIRDQRYSIGTLVAFSGEVDDKESGPDPFTEKSRALNPDLRGRGIKEAFDTDEFNILLVANKFQTGFDQPLLCAMYVDRRLAGVQAVQTLSRLNRSYSRDGAVKDTTYVLDFSDSTQEVLTAFSQYYGEAMLEAVTDPNVIYDLRAKLDGEGYYDEFEIERVVRAELDPASKQSDLVKAVEPVAMRLVTRFASAKKDLQKAQDEGIQSGIDAARDTMAALEIFKRDIQTYLRVYAFLSQIFDYGNSSFILLKNLKYEYLVAEPSWADFFMFAREVLNDNWISLSITKRIMNS
jgi:type I restriction enzyme R subunit